MILQLFTTLIVLKCLLSLINKIWDGDFPEEWNSASIISIPEKKKKKKKKKKKETFQIAIIIVVFLLLMLT